MQSNQQSCLCYIGSIMPRLQRQFITEQNGFDQCGMSRLCVSGGFFDGKTGAEARREYLLDLLKQAADETSGSACNNVLSDHEVGLSHDYAPCSQHHRSVLCILLRSFLRLPAIPLGLHFCTS